MNETRIGSKDIPAFISPDNLLIRSYPATPWKSLYVPGTDVDCESYHARITVVGIGQLGAKVAKLLATNSYGIDCYEVLFDPTASDIAETAALVKTIKESHLLFVISGFEDNYCELLFNQLAGTGKKAGVLTVGVVPEGDSWQSCSSEHFANQSKLVDTLLYVSDRPVNEQQCQLMANSEQRTALLAKSLRDAIANIAHLITVPGMIGVDFADIKGQLRLGNIGKVGTGAASVADSGRTAALSALEQLYKQSVNMESVTGVIVCLQGPAALWTMKDYEDALQVIREHITKDLNFAVGLLVNETQEHNFEVTIVAMQYGRP